MILLDTHALIWWVEAQGRLSKRAEEAIAQQAPVLISPISCWELGTLVEGGRLALDRSPTRWVRDLFESERVGPAGLTPLAAVDASHLPDFHGDPADRLIYATARDLGCPLVTKDVRMKEYARQHRDVEVVW